MRGRQGDDCLRMVGSALVREFGGVVNVGDDGDVGFASGGHGLRGRAAIGENPRLAGVAAGEEDPPRRVSFADDGDCLLLEGIEGGVRLRVGLVHELEDELVGAVLVALRDGAPEGLELRALGGVRRVELEPAVEVEHVLQNSLRRFTEQRFSKFFKQIIQLLVQKKRIKEIKI